MRRVTFDRLPLDREAGRTILDNPGIDGACAWWTGARKDNPHAAVFGPGCAFKTEAEVLAARPQAEVVWTRAQAAPQAPAGGRTQAALRLLERDPNLSPFAAAKQAGVHVSAVYRALARRVRPVCECCGQRLPA
jgi:hypothetical protein